MTQIPTRKMFEFRSENKSQVFRGYAGTRPIYSGKEQYQYFFEPKTMSEDDAKQWLANNSLNFGKHKGTPILEVEGSYLKWIIDSVQKNQKELVSGGFRYGNYKRSEYISNMIHHCCKFTTIKQVDTIEEIKRIERAEKLKSQKKAKLAIAAKTAQQSKGLDFEFEIVRNAKQVMNAKYQGLSNNGKHIFRIDGNTLLYLRNVKALEKLDLVENEIYKLEGKIQIFSGSYDKVRRGGLVGLKVCKQ